MVDGKEVKWKLLQEIRLFIPNMQEQKLSLTAKSTSL